MLQPSQASTSMLLKRPARPPSVLLGRRRLQQTPLRRSSAAADAAASSAAALSPQHQPPPRALEAAARLAASRLAESRRGADALFSDPFAEILARADGEQQQQQQQGKAAAAAGSAAAESAAAESAEAALLDAVATRYLDECLLNATGATSVTRMAKGEDYRQVVLLGVDGGDCRPFRLPWPEGTVVFLVAPAEVHERAEALLAAAAAASSAASASSSSEQDEGASSTTTTTTTATAPPARVPRGCLLRRVDLDTAALQRAAAAAAVAEEAPAPAPSSSPSSSCSEQQQQQQQQQHPDTATIFMDALTRAGFRGDRVSVWGLQGLQGLLGPRPPSGGDEAWRRALGALLAEVSSSAAFHSLVAGELPGPLSAREGSNLLADAGLLAAVEPPGGAGTREYGRVAAVVVGGGSEGGGEGEGDTRAWPRLFFSAQQLRPSLEQMGIYNTHVDAMEGSDEDFGTLHFS